MFKTGHLIRRSSVRLKSLSGGHCHLLMILSQIKEVRATFKAFVSAQSILSEDLLKWSSTTQNDSLRETFSYLSEFTSMWTEVQKEFADSLKHFKINFESVLEGEKHVAQAKQAFSAREEIEKDLRRELRKAYKKAPSEEIEAIRDKLNRTEKAKELAHLEVVDRVRENEAVRMIRIKEGLLKFGSSYIELSNKANIIFKAHCKVSSEIPDVHDKAIHKIKFDGNACAAHVQEAKNQLRVYRNVSSTSMTDSNERSFHDPPPPYSPVSDKMSDLSLDCSSICIENGDSKNISNSFWRPCAPSQSMASLSSITSPLSNSPQEILCDLETPEEIQGASNGGRHPNLHSNNLSDDFQLISPQMNVESLVTPQVASTKPKKRKPVRPTSPGVSSISSPSNPSFVQPPPYNPFYEWSSFPPDDHKID